MSLNDAIERGSLAVEYVGGALIGLIALVTFFEVAMRSTIGLQIPDAFSLISYAQGIAVFWGIACATYARRHITVDFLYDVLGSRGRILVNCAADIVCAIYFGALAYMLSYAVRRLFVSGERTIELELPLWPLVASASVGIVVATAFCCLMVARGVTALVQLKRPS